MAIVDFTVMSNHIHFLLEPETTRQLSEFMHYVKSNIARKVGRQIGWKGRFWSKRFSAIIVSDEEEAQAARFKYVLSQGVKEGLVRRPAEWPGVQAAWALERGYDEVGGGVWHDRTAQYRASQRVGGKDLKPSDFTQRHLRVRLSPLPAWRHLSPEARRRAISGLIEEIVREGRIARDGRPVLGVKALLRQDPLEAPETVEKRCAPQCHAASREVRLALLGELKEFAVAFRAAAKALLQGQPLSFPPGSFPPGLPYVCEQGLPAG